MRRRAARPRLIVVSALLVAVEPYRPSSVDLVLGNPEVILRDVNGNIVTKGPTASFLFGRPDTDYMDLPGDPLHPGCQFEQDFKRWSEGKPAVTTLLYFDLVERHADSALAATAARPRPAEIGGGLSWNPQS